MAIRKCHDWIQVKRVVVHKDYKAPTFENDIAILELEDPIERQPHVVPICMPDDNDELFLGRMGIVTGWGRLEYGELYFILLCKYHHYIYNNIILLYL